MTAGWGPGAGRARRRLLALGVLASLAALACSGGGRPQPAARATPARATPATAAPPPPTSFPFGVYDKKELNGQEDPRFMPYEQFRAYYHRVFDLLRRSGINTFVATYFCPADVGPDGVPRMERLLDWAQEQSIRVVLRVNPTGCQAVPGPTSRLHRSFVHPAVAAYMYGDEPEADELAGYRTQYARLRGAGYARPIVSSLVLERTVKGGGSPVRTWAYLSPQIRMGRLYPFRRSDEGLATRAPLTAADKLAVVEAANGATPWWYVYQAFGTNGPDPIFRNPSPAEVTAQMHLALAHGARALIGYSLQNERPKWVALTDQHLGVTDDKLAAIRRFVQLVGPHGDLLLRHRPGPGRVGVDRTDVEAVPRVDPATGERFVYVVNLRSSGASTVRLTLPGPAPAEAVDLYTGTRYQVASPTATPTISVGLAAGQGRLISLGHPGGGGADAGG